MDRRGPDHYFLDMPAKSPSYDRDFFAWGRQQAEFLRSGNLAEADVEHIAEEIDSMGQDRAARADQPPSRSPSALSEMAISAGEARRASGGEHSR